jgi:hypothetical protein
MKLLPPTDGERRRLSRLLFICAFGFFVLGFVIGFYPGSEQGYFIFVACLFLVPMLIPRGGYQVIAASFLFISLLLALYGHWRGVQYRTWLAEHPLNFIAFVNQTGHDLQRVEVRFSGVKNAGPGELAKGEYATFGFLNERVPNEALVTWDEDSIHHEVTVKLEDVVPPGFAYGTIYFNLRADGSITIKTAGIRDSNANQEILKDLTERRAG